MFDFTEDVLKHAGVLSLAEAKAAYNNLNNLKIEHMTCNVSHDYEGNSDSDDEEML